MKFYLVDVFAREKYQGNQLAVVLAEEELTAGKMQQIAREFNFSETSFILPQRRMDGAYNVRIFTPDTEVPFAGHPTLGTAYIIHRVMEGSQHKKVLLKLPAGTIPVRIEHDLLTMEQNQPEFGRIIDDLTMVAGLLNTPVESISSDLPVQIVSTGLPCLVVPVNTTDDLKRLSVNHSLFQGFINDICKCNLMAFAPECDRGGFMVRVFMDDPGFLEDPATGSANGNLAAYLLKNNYFISGSIQYDVSQGSQIGRPSLLKIRTELAAGVYTILVGGKVQLVAQGELL